MIHNWNKAINRLVLIVGIGLLLNLIFTYFISDHFQWQSFSQFSLQYLFLALLLAIFPWFCHALEIRIWSSFFKKKLALKDALRISVATDLGSAVTPTMVGGGPIKFSMLVHKGLSPGQAAAILTLTGIEDMLFFLTIIPLSLYFVEGINLSALGGLWEDLKYNLPFVLAGLATIVLLLFLGLCYLKYKKIGHKIRSKLRTIVADFKKAYSLIIKEGKLYFLAASAAIFLRWVCRFLILVCLVQGLSLQVNYIHLFFSQWLIDLVMTATPTPGAIGGAEASFYFIFKSIIPKAHLGVVMTVWRFFSYYLLLLLAAVFMNVVRERVID